MPHAVLLFDTVKCYQYQDHLELSFSAHHEEFALLSDGKMY